MQNIQEIFSRIQANKKQLKDLSTSYRDALKNSAEYQDLQEEAKIIREKMKTIRYSKLVMDLNDNNQEMYGLFGGDWLGLDDIKEEYEASGIW